MWEADVCPWILRGKKGINTKVSQEFQLNMANAMAVFQYFTMKSLKLIYIEISTGTTWIIRLAYEKMF